jgi:hypothetical protein
MNTVLPDRANPVTPNLITGSKNVSDTVSCTFSTLRNKPSAIADITTLWASLVLSYTQHREAQGIAQV